MGRRQSWELSGGAIEVASIILRIVEHRAGGSVLCRLISYSLVSSELDD